MLSSVTTILAFSVALCAIETMPTVMVASNEADPGYVENDIDPISAELIVMATVDDDRTDMKPSTARVNTSVDALAGIQSLPSVASDPSAKCTSDVNVA